MRDVHPDMGGLTPSETVRAVDTLARTVNTLAELESRSGDRPRYATARDLAMGVYHGGPDLRSLLTEYQKASLPAFERWARQTQPADSPLRDAELAAATQAWFSMSMKRQSNSLRSNVDEATFQKLHQELHSIQKAALQEDTPSEGGDLVPTIVENEIVRQIKDAAVLFPLCRQIQMTKKVHQVPAEDQAVTVNWVAEEGTLTGGEPTFAQKTLTAKKIAGRATMSIELVEDSNPGLLQYLLEVFSEKMGGEIDKQLVLGDGSSPAITGLNNTSGINVIASSATAAGRNLTWPLLVQTQIGSVEASAIKNGVWIASPKGYGAIFGMVDSTGQPIVKGPDVLGRPVVTSARFGGAPSGVTSTLDDSTNANTALLYGTPNSILAGMRQRMRFETTDAANWASYRLDSRLVARVAMVVGVISNFSRLTKVNVS